MGLQEKPLFSQSSSVSLSVEKGHHLYKLEEMLNWTFLKIIAMNIREQKKLALTGKEPRYRQLLAAIILMAMKKWHYREVEEQIKYYAPARYFCGLMDSDQQVDHVSLFDFVKMLGEEGLSAINQHVLEVSHSKEVLDFGMLMSDTTAQEARIPYPNEVGLMARFGQKAKELIGKLGGKFTGLKKSGKETFEKIKGIVRSHHLFAKGKDAKQKTSKKLFHVVKKLHKDIESLLTQGHTLSSKAGQELNRMTAVMKELLPQMKHFIDTGFVAKNKILHLKMTELYSIVRGKAGKSVEFGLKWCLNRIGNGFLHGFIAEGYGHQSDKKFALQAVEEHKNLFGCVPDTYGFDRGGYSAANIRKLSKKGIKNGNWSA